MNQRDKAIAYISGAIATYSLKKEAGEIQDNMSMYDFCLLYTSPSPRD